MKNNKMYVITCH